MVNRVGGISQNPDAPAVGRYFCKLVGHSYTLFYLRTKIVERSVVTSINRSDRVKFRSTKSNQNDGGRGHNKFLELHIYTRP